MKGYISPSQYKHEQYLLGHLEGRPIRWYLGARIESTLATSMSCNGLTMLSVVDPSSSSRLGEKKNVFGFCANDVIN